MRMRAGVSASPHCVDPVASGPGWAGLPSRRVREWKSTTGRPFPHLREEWRTGPRASSLPIPLGPLRRFDPASMILRSSQTAEAASISGRSLPARAEALLFRTPQGFPPVPKHWQVPVRSCAVRSKSRDRSLVIQISLRLTGRQSREILANLWSYLGCSTKLPPSQSLGGSPQRPRSGGFVSRPGLVRFLLSPEGEKPVPAGPQPSLSLAPRSLRPIRLQMEDVTALRVAKADSACG